MQIWGCPELDGRFCPLQLSLTRILQRAGSNLRAQPWHASQRRNWQVQKRCKCFCKHPCQVEVWILHLEIGIP